MSKIITVFLCIALGFTILGLSLISDNLYCSNSQNICKMQSVISPINYSVSTREFEPYDIEKIYCDKMYRPARSGKKAYFVLKLKIKNSDSEYNLGSYPKYQFCKKAMEPVREFTSKKKDNVVYSSGIGASNILGLILAIMMFVVSFVIYTNKPEQKTYDWEDEDIPDE